MIKYFTWLGDVKRQSVCPLLLGSCVMIGENCGVANKRFGREEAHDDLK